MWTLFTTALARGHSTTQVSIMNTSSNFVITAILGLAIFAESLPPLWWLGAALLVAGNVIIGRQNESVKTDESDAQSAAGDGELDEGLDGGLAPERQQPGMVPGDEEGGLKEEEDDDVVDLGDESVVEVR